MTHGTPSVDGDAFWRALAKRSPTGFNSAAIAFAERGYAAVAVMRRGYGRSGGVFSETLPKACDFLSAARVSAEDVIATVAALRKQTWVDPDHMLLLGHSTGGLAVTAAAASRPPGVVGVLNFDGGRHAPSDTGEPCASDHLVDTFAALGHEVRLPALWLYAENDRSYGPDLARRMFDAYTAGGAPARLQLLPPFSSDGHDLITKADTESWLPSVAPFLAALGLPTAPVVTPPPP